MTATATALEPLSSWWQTLGLGNVWTLTRRERTTRRSTAAGTAGTDAHYAGRRMRVGTGYCGTVQLTGRYTLSPHTEVRLYEDTEGRLHYLANLRPAASA
jgi:hypothetical protein